MRWLGLIKQAKNSSIANGNGNINAALTMFIVSGLLTWEFVVIGLFLAAGNILGAILGVNMAVKRGAKFLRYMLMVAILIASIKLFIPQIQGLFS